MEQILTYLGIAEYEKIAPIYDIALREHDHDILSAIDSFCHFEDVSALSEFLANPCQCSLWPEDEDVSLFDI